MAKIYFQTDLFYVTKSLFGPWKIHDRRRAGIHANVPPHIADRFSGVAAIMKSAGYDLKRDKGAIGAVFTWLISVVLDDIEGKTDIPMFSMDDELLLEVLRHSYRSICGLPPETYKESIIRISKEISNKREANDHTKRVAPKRRYDEYD